MAENTDFQTLKLVGRFEPEPAATFDPTAHDVANPVTGNYTVYAVIDGVYKPLAQFRASGLYADIERAKAANSGAADTSSDTSEPDFASLEARLAELERQSGKTGPTVEPDASQPTDPPQPNQ